MIFYPLVKPYRMRALYILFCLLMVNLLSLTLPWGIKLTIDQVLPTGNILLLTYIVLGLVAVLCLQSFFNFSRRMTGYVIGERIACDLRQKIYFRIQGISFDDIQKITPSQILTRITGDVESIRRFIFSDVVESIYAFLSFGLIIVLLCWINPYLTLIVLLVMPLIVLMYLRAVSRLKNGYQRLREANGRLFARINEVLNGMAVVRIFAAEKYEKEKFVRNQKEIFDISTKNHQLNVGLWSGVNFFSSLGILCVLWVGGREVVNQRMTSGDLIAFYSYLGMLFAPLLRLVNINSSYREACVAFNRIDEINQIDQVVRQSQPPVAFSRINGFIEFRDVAFGYSKNKNIVEGISFSVGPGEVVGIVGSSGAGKTTLMNLIVRFFEPSQGEILVDGNSLRDLDLDAYRREVAMVLQDDYFFSGTIQRNIRYGKNDASFKEIENAARIAHADAFIKQLKHGYLTPMGERGMQLSCGQRQRIAIARAVLRNPSILILDEATSAVDAITENNIQRSIRQWMQGKILFIVAHRFSTIMDADKIIVLDKGRIVEVGDHDYLLKKRGFYSNLYFEQFKEKDQSSLKNLISRV